MMWSFLIVLKTIEKKTENWMNALAPDFRSWYIIYIMYLIVQHMTTELYNTW